METASGGAAYPPGGAAERGRGSRVETRARREICRGRRRGSTRFRGARARCHCSLFWEEREAEVEGKAGGEGEDRGEGCRLASPSGSGGRVGVVVWPRQLGAGWSVGGFTSTKLPRAHTAGSTSNIIYLHWST